MMENQLEVYKTQFCIISEANGWTEGVKACQLAASLRGEAAEVLQTLPDTERLNLNSCVTLWIFGSARNTPRTTHACNENKTPESRLEFRTKRNATSSAGDTVELDTWEETVPGQERMRTPSLLPNRKTNIWPSRAGRRLPDNEKPHYKNSSDYGSKWWRQETLHDLVKDLLQNTDLDEKQRCATGGLIKEFHSLFSRTSDDFGRTRLTQHPIDTREHPPIKQQPRRLPFAKQEGQKLIKDMQDNDVIEPSSSPWASPIILVKEKDGSTRFCLDYLRLNDITKKDIYPLPRIDDTLDTLAGNTWFSP
ncbi:retrovirus-related Pol polyprotein from transposon 412 [Trichonephila clavipes]|nr:retrovirus-related Pol polyprotein from transposon 412 [Trichonephila clavipes]